MSDYLTGAYQEDNLKGLVGNKLQRPTTRQQLEYKKQMLENELSVVNEALATLDQYPDLEKFNEVIKRAI